MSIQRRLEVNMVKEREDIDVHLYRCQASAESDHHIPAGPGTELALNSESSSATGMYHQFARGINGYLQIQASNGTNAWACLQIYCVS